MFVMDLFPSVSFKDCLANALIDLYAKKHIDKRSLECLQTFHTKTVDWAIVAEKLGTLDS